MKGLADKGEREEKRRNEGQKGLGDMNPLTHITITPRMTQNGHSTGDWVSGPVSVRVCVHARRERRTAW